MNKDGWNAVTGRDKCITCKHQAVVILQEPDSSADNNAQNAAGQEDNNNTPSAQNEQQFVLSDSEKDAVGEISNISMGTAATTLSSLLNQKVNITTPTVEVSTWYELSVPI